jgi:integrase
MIARWTSSAGVSKCHLKIGRRFFWELPQAPIRAAKTHDANMRAIGHLQQAFGKRRLADLTAEEIEQYLRRRLKQHARVKDWFRFQRGPSVEANHGASGVSGASADTHCRRAEEIASGQSLSRCRVPRLGQRSVPSALRRVVGATIDRIPCPWYFRKVVRIITETVLRVYKELAPMKKDQVDLENAFVWIPDSKTTNGVADVPLTELALTAFRDQMKLAGPGPYLFPRDKNGLGHQTTFKTVWHETLKRAKIPYFRIYDLRSTYATWLSAGDVADEWVTQMLRQGDAKVFKKYSQMKREASEKINRHANEDRKDFGSIVVQ